MIVLELFNIDCL